MSAWARFARPAHRFAQSRIARNWSVLVVSNLLVQVLAMLATVRIARELAPTGYGEFNLVQALAMLGMLLAGLGTRQVLIRICAREPLRTPQLLLAAGSLRLAAFVVVAVAILVYTASDQQDLTLTLGLAAVAAMAGLTAWDLLESVAFGHQQMGFSSALSLAGAIVWVACAWLAPGEWLTPLSVCVAFAALQGVRVVAYLGLARRAGYLSRAATLDEPTGWRRGLLRSALPFYWLGIVSAATTQVPILFLANQAGQAEVGFYNAGFRLTTPLQMMLVSAFTALYPALAHAAVTAEPRFNRMVRGALIGTVVLGTAGAILISSIRHEVVQLLFGPAYLPAADAVAVQCWYSVLLAVSTLIGTVLAASDRQRLLAILSTIGALVALPVLWILAAQGAYGLAFGLALTAGLSLAFHWLVVGRSLPRTLSPLFGLGLAAILALGMAFTWLVPDGWTWQVRLLTGGGVVLAIGLVVGFVVAGSLLHLPLRVSSTLRVNRSMIR